ncbi:hypothetical protein A2696_02445 [Candidatus Curtissbacteria bacterium RIFCSPHIGHO2_01_FULL_41_13]|uniref:Membrane protein 6-pyruvoyl-tetrahydropterin synthase-related domain-containing protein n=1 Tax=Candidatus Curtissbacteria bacterium RIFCSPHIGHO2_01_FULL_41_13 TaxID=1797745 RepID=A0A1F5G0P8_9BACT|nr:MAG: hypothetical protein A2696_02445 [Candidatus Curtissbacteria bacterium RIFCSPHIGHO2_01_FULL_41_13]
MRVFLLFVLLSLALFWPIFLGKVNLNGNLLVSFYAPYGQNLPFKNTGWDQLRIYFPFYKITFESLKKFTTPLWNPYAFSGHPHMADFQTAVFYPLNIFGLVLSQVTFWHLLRITPMILAAFFTFLYLKNLKPFDSAFTLTMIRHRNEQGKLSGMAAFFGALTFGFSPFILTWGEEVVMSVHSIIWLPLILFAIEKFLTSPLRHPERSEGSTLLDRLLRFARNDKRLYLAVIALSTSFSFFGGYMQTTIYLFIFVFLYLLLKLGKNLFLSALGWKLMLALILGTLIAGVQLLPSGELFFLSARSQIRLTSTLTAFLLPLEALVTLLAPDFFGSAATWNFFRSGVAQYYEGIIFFGVAALIFALFAIFAKKQKSFLQQRAKLIQFLAIVGVIALSLTIDLPTTRLYLMLPIPFLSSSIANRILFVPAFCLSALAAIGFDLWQRTADRQIFRTIAPLAFLYILLIGYLAGVRFFGFPYFDKGLSAAGNAMISARNLVVPFGVFVASSLLIVVASYRSRYKGVCAAAIIAVAFLHTFYFSQKYFSFSNKKNIFPQNAILNFIQKNQGIWRSWGVGRGYFETNFASQYGIFWPGGYDSLNNRSYGEFTYSGKDVDISQFSFRADAGLGGKDKVSEFLREDKRRIADLLGVKYVIVHKDKDDEETMAKNNFMKVFEDGNFGVFENLQVMPRAFLASNYEGPPHPDNTGLSTGQLNKIRRKLIPQKLFASDFDWRNVLVLEKPSPVSPQFGQGTVNILSYRPQEVIIKTRSNQPKLLFLSDNYYPGWKAEVDGSRVDILRANYTFRAVPLVPGEHLVRFWYDSEVFKIGLVISLLSLVILGFVTLKPKSR